MKITVIVHINLLQMNNNLRNTLSINTSPTKNTIDAYVVVQEIYININPEW